MDNTAALFFVLFVVNDYVTSWSRTWNHLIWHLGLSGGSICVWHTVCWCCCCYCSCCRRRWPWLGWICTFLCWLRLRNLENNDKLLFNSCEWLPKYDANDCHLYFCRSIYYSRSIFNWMTFFLCTSIWNCMVNITGWCNWFAT